MLADGIESYIQALQPERDEVLAAMEADAAQRGFPIIGPLVGRLAHLVASSIGARRVFEMGSGFGYSTVWFARAVGPDGRVIHTDGDPELSSEAQQWLGKAGLAGRVEHCVGDALALLEADSGPYDVVFIDVDKHDYPRCWDLARTRVRVGGFIITDNTLWSGNVLDASTTDAWTQAIRAYNEAAHADPDFESIIIPLRDGVTVSRRVR